MKKNKAKTRLKSKRAQVRSIGPDIVSDFWPQERDYMSRPERFRYVRKLIKTKGCVFCKSRDLGASDKSLCVYKNKWAMVILNKYPYNSGHVMVLPTRHCGDLTALSLREFTEVQNLLRLTVKAVLKAYRVEGMNIGLNMGKVAGAGIPKHLHWHIIPRWMGDTNFFPLIAETKIIPEDLNQSFAKIKKELLKLL